jgi:predicted RNase H-like nuclease
MAQILKFTYPTGKIFIGFCSDEGGDDFSAFDWLKYRAEIATLPVHERVDYTIRRQVLWEDHEVSSDELFQRWQDIVSDYNASDPEVGYNMPSDKLKAVCKADGWKFGVDGCRAGWFYIGSQGSDIKYGIVKTIAELFDRFKNIAEVVIDIPIGLYDEGAQARSCDSLARKALKPRGSTVFPAPVRPCLYADTYEEACRISERLTGKKLSQQAYNIFAKIREVDELLQRDASLRSVISEAHPELGFCMLNGGNPLLTKKKNSDGIAERLALLKRYLEWAPQLYEEATSQYARQVLAKDDIVDAMMCLCIAQAPEREKETVPAPVIHDGQGIEMAMHIFSPSQQTGD